MKSGLPLRKVGLMVGGVGMTDARSSSEMKGGNQ